MSSATNPISAKEDRTATSMPCRPQALLHIVLTSLLFAMSLADDDDSEPQKVVIESNESWQNGVVLIYSTALLIGLRLSATIRHSPLSPLRFSILRMHAYAIAMLIVGSLSTLTLLLLSVFPATRDTASSLMPCASPLLAIGAVLALCPQTRAPEWDSQQLTALMGVPTWLAIVTAVIFNGMTIAASVLNGAWAATSISLATTLVAIFGPRTPVIRNTLANGIVEPGGPLIFKVCQFGEEAIIAMSFWKTRFREFGFISRELLGSSWLKLQSIDDFGHDKRLRIGAYPIVRKVIIDEDRIPQISLLSDSEPDSGRCVQLISGETSDVVGYMRLEDWLRNPFGDDVAAIQIWMDDFTMQILGSKIWSACSKNVNYDFPGAHFTYWLVLRKILEPVRRPDHKALGLVPGMIDLSEEMGVHLDEFSRCLLRVEEITESLPQPHCNILRILLSSKLSKHFGIHVEEVLHVMLDAVAGAISNDCISADKNGVDIEEICVIFEGIDENMVEYDEVYAVVTDKKGRTVHWITKSNKANLEDHLGKAVHAIVMSDQNQDDIDASGHVLGVQVQRKSDGRLGLSNTAIPVSGAIKGNYNSKSVQELGTEEWNESRLTHPQGIWPSNWDRREPGSAIATVKGMAEIASLQGVTSGIAAGSVLLGSLLGG